MKLLDRECSATPYYCAPYRYLRGRHFIQYNIHTTYYYNFTLIFKSILMDIGQRE